MVSGSEGEMAERGLVLARNQPWWVLAESIGRKAARALLAIIQEIVPEYVPDVRVGWSEIGPHTTVVIWAKGIAYQATAKQVADRFKGIVADYIDGRWVKR